MNKKFFTKKYKLSNLLDSEELIKKRVAQINNFNYLKYKALSPTTIEIVGDRLFYTQEFYQIIKKNNFEMKDFFDLCEALDYFNSINFIHGDINHKNVIYTPKGFKIIDYEPSLKQIKRKTKKLMVTLPYICKTELKTGNITSLTDKIGFFYLVLRLKGVISTFDIAFLAKNLKHKFFDVNELKNMPYNKILEEAFKTYRKKFNLLKRNKK